jgi:hypothetical protein
MSNVRARIGPQSAKGDREEKTADGKMAKEYSNYYACGCGGRTQTIGGYLEWRTAVGC